MNIINVVKGAAKNVLQIHSFWIIWCPLVLFRYYLGFFADLGALGNYPGSPFLPSESDMLLESPDQDINNGKCLYTYIYTYICITFSLLDVLTYNYFGEQ